MTEHEIPSVRRSSLSRQLAGLGLVRLLGEQADPAIHCHFKGTSLVIDTTVDDLERWLVDEYSPTPVLNPWNEGSGFGAKDKAPKEALDRLLSLETPRLAEFRKAYEVSAPIAAQARAKKWPKERTIAALRGRCPDSMLAWLDTAVVLLNNEKGNELAFPPLLGSGGNDGRLDFSTNFHQRLLDVLPTDDPSRQRSLELAGDHLNGTADQPLTRAAIGQFDPGSAGTPNSSPFGSADPLVNPWTYILMLEGAALFASAPARRLTSDAAQHSRAAMPFMTFGAAQGTSTGSDTEDFRGEIWFPWWRGRLSLTAIRQLFSEGRAVWRGHIANQSAQMYLAAGSQGFSPAIGSFDRYTIAKRNGLAFSAVLADTVRVQENHAVRAIATVEDWPDWIRGRELPNTIRAPQNRFRRARIDLARAATPTGQIRRLREPLCALTDLELAVGRSGRSREDIQPWGVPRSPLPLIDLFHEWGNQIDVPEFRLALALASFVTEPMNDAPHGRTMRELLVPIDPALKAGERASWRQAPIVPGFRRRPLVDVLSDLLVWLVVLAPRHAASKKVADREVTPIGVILPKKGIPARWHDTHAWVNGALDDSLIEDWLAALLPFDWHETQPPFPEIAADPLGLVDPTLALLTLFRNGISRGRGDARRYGLQSEWIVPLVGGNPERAHAAAGSRLRMLGREPVAAPVRSLPGDDATRIAAALLPYVKGANPNLISRRIRTDDDTGEPRDNPKDDDLPDAEEQDSA
ncbi:MAG: type I-U CRISPR-associated protein Csx17 [Frankiaceae bacterium]|jgi:CRISPR-associated protein Csx17|nr:type I-U CRISPR-associated protein Csx17 [Frankiaceae bacterium]